MLRAAASLLILVAAGCGGAAATMTPPKPPDTAPVIAALVAKHGEAQRARIQLGVTQAAARWRADDGDFAAFALEHFVADPALLDASFTRVEDVMETIDGHMLEIGRALRSGTELELGALLPIDPLLAAYEPAAHVYDDLFTAKVAFEILLNFRITSLAEKQAEGATWSRRQWAETQLAGRFACRIPGDIRVEAARANTDADLYIANYNIWMHHVLGAGGTRPFPSGMRLISHWNLRDEIKAEYSDPTGLTRQRLIVAVMERIVTQSIPAAVIDNPRVDWDPVANTVVAAPAAEVEADAPARATAAADATREPDTRYARMLAHFAAARKIDPHCPASPTAIARAFEREGAMSEERVIAILTQVLESPLVPRVGAAVQRRLGRPLEPHDIWFAGFKARSKVTETQLDAITRQRYPDRDAFAADLPRILRDLGFSPEKAAFLAEHIVVDPSRGAGHALQAERRGDLPHLRTRIGAGGMDYKGYNIAVHELGHSVEQVFSLYEIDHTLLRRVPSNAFTEALAFVFQARDLELLGLGEPDAESTRLHTLDLFWEAYEIAGVSLVDIQTWHWMYDHPNATPAELREAVTRIAREVWNKYYAPVLGSKDSPLLGIYSHMIAYPLYLYGYPIGHLIALQIEEHVAKAADWGAEIERMARLGQIAPDLWMTNATGAPVGAESMLRATEAALAAEPAAEPAAPPAAK